MLCLCVYTRLCSAEEVLSHGHDPHLAWRGDCREDHPSVGVDLQDVCVPRDVQRVRPAHDRAGVGSGRPQLSDFEAPARHGPVRPDLDDGRIEDHHPGR